MTPIKNESGKMAMAEEQIDSPSTGDGSSGEPVAGGDGLKKGPWTSAEDVILMEYVNKHGDGNWNNVQKYSGLSRCGKSCRLRWANHLRPNLKKGTITPEEERMIIQLHSQWGNKWARMAAMLPGRTDNEIKNYWNTRAKRCERTGVALHPPEMCFDGNLQSQDVTNFGSLHKQYNGVMQGSTYGTIPEIRFDNYKVNPVFSPYVSYVPNIPSSIQGYGSKNYDSVDPTENHIKRLRETKTSLPGFHGSLCGGVPTCEQFSTWPSESIDPGYALASSFDPDTSTRNLNHFEIAVPGTALSNGNVSSSRPLPGTGELELPSFQNNETGISNWIACPSSPQGPQREADSYIQSPLETTSDSISPRNLLEAVPQQWSGGTIDQQAQTGWILPDFMSSEMLESSALNHGDASWGDHGEPITPLGNSSGSGFSANSSDEFQSSEATSGSELMSDALVGSDLYAERYGGAKENYMLNDVLKELLAEGSQFKQMPPETVPSTAIQGSGSERYPSKNMPPINQRSGTPSNVPDTCL